MIRLGRAYMNMSSYGYFRPNRWPVADDRSGIQKPTFCSPIKKDRVGSTPAFGRAEPVEGGAKGRRTAAPGQARTRRLSACFRRKSR